jgi:endoglucanase
MDPTMITRRTLLAGAAAFSLGPADTFAQAPIPYRGVNLAGGEFGSALPGDAFTDYVYPYNEEIDYYVSKGMNVFRIPFRWERLQRDLDGPLSAPDLAELDRIVAHASGRGAAIVLDPHNYGRRRIGGSEVVIGESSALSPASFAGFWTQLAQHYRSNRNVLFGLMNEPHDQNGAILLSVLNHAIRAIRSAGATNLVLVPGNAWTGAHSWISSGNGELMLGVDDPARNFAYEVHQYLDSDSSGTSPNCVTGAGAARLKLFTEWARANRQKGFLGEFGAAANAGCLAELRDLMLHLQANSDVWIGWTYWAGGPWWGGYDFSIEPASLTAPVDRPQMRALLPFL